MEPEEVQEGLVRPAGNQEWKKNRITTANVTTVAKRVTSKGNAHSEKEIYGCLQSANKNNMVRNRGVRGSTSWGLGIMKSP